MNNLDIFKILKIIKVKFSFPQFENVHSFLQLFLGIFQYQVTMLKH